MVGPCKLFLLFALPTLSKCLFQRWAVNIHDPDASALAAKRETEHNVKLLLLILTDARPDVVALRSTMRETWLSWAQSSKGNVQYRFVVQEGTTTSIRQEMTTHGDFLELDVPDHCRSPSCQSGHLTRSAFTWALQNASSDIDYILRTETDTFLCVPSLYAMLADRHKGGQQPLPLFMGHYHVGGKLGGGDCRADENFQLTSRSLIKWFLESYHFRKTDPAYLPNSRGYEPTFHYKDAATFAHNFSPFVNTLGALGFAEVVDDPIAVAWVHSLRREIDDDIYGLKQAELTSKGSFCENHVFAHPVTNNELMRALWQNSSMNGTSSLSIASQSGSTLTIKPGHCKEGIPQLDSTKVKALLEHIRPGPSSAWTIKPGHG